MKGYMVEKVRIDMSYFQQLLEALDTTDEKNFALYNKGKKIVRNIVGSKKVEIDLSEYEFKMLAQSANELNLTFSEYCNVMLEEYIRENEKKS